MPTRILIVDDETALASSLKDNFEFEGYQVDTANSGEQALDLLRGHIYDLMILDVMMPGQDGFQVLTTFRESNNRMPVIFLSARSAEEDRIQGLRLGADDYLVKPFSLVELIERVKAILRRTAPLGTASDFGINGRIINFQNRTITHHEEESNMSPFEARILELLLSEKDHTFTRSEILERIWGTGVYPSDRTIDNYIVKLRHKLEDDPKNPLHLLTVHGEGYRWKP